MLFQPDAKPEKVYESEVDAGQDNFIWAKKLAAVQTCAGCN
jgi:hypothetical protein